MHKKENESLLCLPDGYECFLCSSGWSHNRILIGLNGFSKCNNKKTQSWGKDIYLGELERIMRLDMIICYYTHMKFSIINTNINKDSKLKFIKFTLAIQKFHTQRAEWIVE